MRQQCLNCWRAKGGVSLTTPKCASRIQMRARAEDSPLNTTYLCSPCDLQSDAGRRQGLGPCTPDHQTSTGESPMLLRTRVTWLPMLFPPDGRARWTARRRRVGSYYVVTPPVWMEEPDDREATVTSLATPVSVLWGNKRRGPAPAVVPSSSNDLSLSWTTSTSR